MWYFLFVSSIVYLFYQYIASFNQGKKLGASQQVCLLQDRLGPFGHLSPQGIITLHLWIGTGLQQLDECAFLILSVFSARRDIHETILANAIDEVELGARLYKTINDVECAQFARNHQGRIAKVARLVDPPITDQYLAIVDTVELGCIIQGRPSHGTLDVGRNA